MTLSQIVASVEAELEGWAAPFRPSEPVAVLEKRRARLDQDLRRRYTLLVSQRAILDGLRHRLKVTEARAATLADHASMYLNLGDGQRAWQLALELDQARTQLARERVQLASHEAAYRQQRADIDAIKEDLGALRETIARRRQTWGT